MRTKIIKDKLNVIIPLLGVTRGGGIRVISEIANGLTNRRHNVTLVTVPIDFFPFPLNKGVKLMSRVRRINENSFIGNLRNYFFIYQMCLKFNGIILSNYYTTFFIGWILQVFNRKKHVYFIQGYEAEFFDTSQSLINKFKTFLAKITYSLKANLRITISEFIKKKIGEEDIVIINDGIDLLIFKPPVTTFEGPKKIIATIAMPEIRKGFFDFANAIQILNRKRNDFEILLFTSHRDIKLDIPFSYTLKFPTNDYEVVGCLQTADIFVSSSHLEGFGLPGLEAMACGAALITTNSGGITQYAINEVNALIVNVGDVDSIVLSLERLLDNLELLNKLKQEGVKTAKNFTWDIMCESFERELIKIS